MLNEAECLPRLHAELRAACDALPYRFEFLFVDDGSTDASPDVLADLRRQDERVGYLRLSRNFGHQAALSAGLAHAAGDAVIMMDGDLQHPPALIPAMLQRYEEGYDVVNTARQDTARIHPLKRGLSGAFYQVFNWFSSVRIEPGSADFRLLGRAVVDALNDLPEVHRFLRGLVPWLGFRQTTIPFRAPERWAGQSKYTLWRSLRLALEGITSFSFYPLRRLAVLGWVIMLLSLLYGIFSLAAHLITDSTVPGWTSLMVCVLFLGGWQLLSLGVMSEYVGRVLEQVKGRPLYLVREAVGLAPARTQNRLFPSAPPPARAIDDDIPRRRAG
jgi:dolichol-phosphate mannosyltransferase